MVTINFTIIVQVGLFLLFMAAMNRWIFRPMLRLLDERAERVRADETQAGKSTEEAKKLERTYALQLAGIHRDASQRALAAQREAQEKHMQHILAMKRQEDAEIKALRAQYKAQIDEERERFGPIIEGLTEVLARKMAPRGGQS